MRDSDIVLDESRNYQKLKWMWTYKVADQIPGSYARPVNCNQEIE